MNLRNFIFIAAFATAVVDAYAENLVILHTNDTHSSIDPASDGMGGVLQRKAIIDSIRSSEKNVILVDAGDVVQGSLYFKFFHGDVEYPLMDMMGYDIRVLGNHEFDNGIESLASYYRKVKGVALSANYDFSDTPLNGIFSPTAIKEFDGRRIGFIGINVNPHSLIAENNYRGIKWNEIIPTTDSIAYELKNKEKCNLVVVVSHIGYQADNNRIGDVDLARASHNIDIIIGGHSHTLIDPLHPEIYPHNIPNADGRSVLITQTGKYGKYLGKIKIPLDSCGIGAEAYNYSLIPITDRFPKEKLDKNILDFIKPYREKVDSINSVKIATSASDMNGEEFNNAYGRWAADFAMQFGIQIMDSLCNTGSLKTDFAHPNFAIMNTGGIRHDMKRGAITEGQILSTFPFSNHMVLVEIKGEDLLEALQVAALKGGEAVSRELLVSLNSDRTIHTVLINGIPLDKEQRYLFSTIDYVAWGNDDLEALARGTIVWMDNIELSTRILKYIRTLGNAGIPITADPNPRFVIISD